MTVWVVLADRTFTNEMWWGPIGVDAGRLVFHGVLDAHALWQMEPHALGRPFGRLGDHLLDKRFGLVGLSSRLASLMFFRPWVWNLQR